MILLASFFYLFIFKTFHPSRNFTFTCKTFTFSCKSSALTQETCAHSQMHWNIVFPSILICIFLQKHSFAKLNIWEVNTCKVANKHKSIEIEYFLLSFIVLHSNSKVLQTNTHKKLDIIFPTISHCIHYQFCICIQRFCEIIQMFRKRTKIFSV